jgi:hypothetical protein
MTRCSQKPDAYCGPVQDERLPSVPPPTTRRLLQPTITCIQTLTARRFDRTIRHPLSGHPAECEPNESRCRGLERAS